MALQSVQMNRVVTGSRAGQGHAEGAGRPGTHGDGADPAGLGADDAAGGAQAALDVIVQDELRHLRGLPAARLAADHRHAVPVDQPHQLLPQAKTQQSLCCCCKQIVRDWESSLLLWEEP